MASRRGGARTSLLVAAAAGASLLQGAAAQQGQPADPAASAKPAPITTPGTTPATTPTPAPQEPRVRLAAKTFHSVADAGKDEVVLVVESLHLELLDEGTELRADHAVLWGGHEMLELMKFAGGKRPDDPLRFGPQVPAAPGRSPLQEAGADQTAFGALRGLREIYCEGHVFFRQGDERVVLAERLYQHLLERRGVIVEADAYGRSAFREHAVNVHVRAQALRILGPAEFAAEEASFSTCSFGHPHWHVASSTMHAHVPAGLAESVAAGGAGAEGDRAGLAVPGAAQIALSGNALELGDTPILPLPPFTADLSQGDSLPLKKTRLGHSTKFGGFAETLWGADMPGVAQSLTDEFGLDRPLELGWEANADFYSKRGVGLGPALDWKVPGLIEGDLGGYWIHDQADQDFSQPFVIDNPDRSRAWFRDRYTPVEFWRLDTEVNWLSDAGLQPEYFEREFKEQKAPETYAHLVRQQETTRLRFLYSDRLNDFQTQVEELPQATFDQVGEPLWKLPLGSFLGSESGPNYLVLTHYEDFSNHRLHPADDVTTIPSERVTRGDMALELATTVPIGPVSIRPFAAGQFTAWDRGTATEETIGRSSGSAGARAEMMVHRNFDAWAPSLGIDGLRHIALFDVDYANVYGVSRDASDIVQIDDVDALKETEVWLLAVRQRLQTHRAVWSGGVLADTVVNVLEFDLELPVYPDQDRDNLGRDDPLTAGDTTGPLHYELVHRPGFSHKALRNATIFSDGNWNLADGRMDEFNIGAQLEPVNEWTTIASWRATRGVSHVLTGQIDWRVGEKWSLALFEQYDFDEHGALEQRIELRRHGHDFTFAMGFERDHGDGDTSFTFAIYPSFMLRGLAKKTFSSERGEAPSLSPGQY